VTRCPLASPMMLCSKMLKPLAVWTAFRLSISRELILVKNAAKGYQIIWDTKLRGEEEESCQRTTHRILIHGEVRFFAQARSGQCKGFSDAAGKRRLKDASGKTVGLKESETQGCGV
jgi:hypothetical protein